MSGLYGNVAGGFGMPKIIEIVDDNGNSFVGTVTDSEVVLDATRDDVKIGKIFAGNDGIEEGNDTKTYRVDTGTRYISADSEFKIILEDYDMYDYSQLQAMIMPYDTSMDQSTAVNKTVINNSVYNTGSNTAVSSVSIDNDNKAINLGITNGSTPHIIRYFLYKEEI
ncbi:MAG: hypothetical protein ACI4XN_12565 [Candidatus Kurthia intestinigallinarum]